LVSSAGHERYAEIQTGAVPPRARPRSHVAAVLAQKPAIGAGPLDVYRDLLAAAAVVIDVVDVRVAGVNRMVGGYTHSGSKVAEKMPIGTYPTRRHHRRNRAVSSDCHTTEAKPQPP
jgi:hypothetical protein